MPDEWKAGLKSSMGLIRRWVEDCRDSLVACLGKIAADESSCVVDQGLMAAFAKNDLMSLVALTPAKVPIGVKSTASLLSQPWFKSLGRGEDLGQLGCDGFCQGRVIGPEGMTMSD